MSLRQKIGGESAHEEERLACDSGVLERGLAGVVGGGGSGSGSGRGLAEIVVTAQKRQKDLDKVPISISAFDQSQMDVQGVREDSNQAPWTVAANIQYDFIILDGQSAYVRPDDELRSKKPGLFTFENPKAASYRLQQANPSINLLNLRIGTLVHCWDVSSYGSNLPNSDPLLNLTPDTSLAPLGHAYTITPRTIGLTSVYRW